MLKMKKIIKLVIVLFLIFILLQLFVLILKKEHNVVYEIKNSKKVFKIEERLFNNNYYIKINKDDYVFSFKVSNNYFKKKKIIREIEFYEIDDVLCIYPVLDKDNLGIYCSNKKIAYTYSYNNDNLDGFVDDLKDKGYVLNYHDNNEFNKIRLGKTVVYEDNLVDDTYIYVWKYDGFYTISKEGLEELKVFDNDTYVNDLGILVNNYYVIPNYDQRLEVDTFYVFNLINNKKKMIKSKNKISKDSYINGIVDDKIYIFDVDNLLQYEINPKKKKIKEVGNKKNEGLFYDGKWHNISVYDLRDEQIKFSTSYDYLEDIVDVTSLKYISKNDELYYYLDFDDNFFVYDSISDVKTLLFNVSSLSYVTNVLDDIYFIKENTLYLYNKSVGIKAIFVYEELRFNTKNRVAIYKR